MGAGLAGGLARRRAEGVRRRARRRLRAVQRRDRARRRSSPALRRCGRRRRSPRACRYRGPNVPVLVLSGRDDLRTPLESARRTAAQYPNAKVLAVPGVGHSVLTHRRSGCALKGMVAFLRGQPVAPCSRTTGSRRSTSPRPTRRRRSATCARSCSAGSPGRRSARSRVTLDRRRLRHRRASAARPAGFPGLRGGYFRVSRTALELHGVEWISGVRVSGRLAHRGGRR